MGQYLSAGSIWGWEITQRSVDLNGSTGYIAITQNTSLPLYNNAVFSVVFHVKPDATPNDGSSFFSEGSTADGDPIYRLFQSGSKSIGLQVVDNDGVELVSATLSSGINNNAWNQIALVDNNGDVDLYVNNVEKSSGNFDYTQGTLTLDTTSIGALVQSSVSGYADILVDNILLYTSALSADDVEDLYEFYAVSPEGIGQDISANRIVNLALNNNGDDSSGNGNIGSLVGGATYSTDLPDINIPV